MIKENAKRKHTSERKKLKNSKKITMAAILVVICILLAACGKTAKNGNNAIEKALETVAEIDSEDTESEVEDNGALDNELKEESNENWQDTNNTTIEDDQYSAYWEIIQDYISFYKGVKSYDEIFTSRLIDNGSSVMNYGTYNNSWLGAVNDEEYFDENALEYMRGDSVSLDAKYYDANGDGVYEMFIVESDNGYMSEGYIHDMWTLVDGEPKYVEYFDARYDLMVTEDGRLMEFMSSGWNSSTCAILEFNSDGTFSATDVVEQVPEGESTFKHNDNFISKEEYVALTDEYYNQKRKDLTKLEGVTIANWGKASNRP